MKYTRRAMFAIAAAAMMASSAPAMAEGVIKFGVAAEPYAPFTVKDATGKWTGWEVDLMDAVCAQTERECEIVETAWDGIIPALTAKQIDMIWSSMSITEERKKTIDFTNMHYNTPSMIMGAKNGDMDITPDHLTGKTDRSSGLRQSISATSTSTMPPQAPSLRPIRTQDEANQNDGFRPAGLCAGRWRGT